ncbi:MAG: 2Fe-2S iron-sulfur cluster-binding protein [Pseudomonadales bacterium]
MLDVAAKGFTVILARSKKSIFVADGSSILYTLRKQGVDVPFNCGTGRCGVCEAAVLSGIPDHRDHVLSDAEKASNQSMMICCSGSLTSELELDL